MAVTRGKRLKDRPRARPKVKELSPDGSIRKSPTVAKLLKAELAERGLTGKVHYIPRGAGRWRLEVFGENVELAGQMSSGLVLLDTQEGSAVSLLRFIREGWPKRGGRDGNDQARGVHPMAVPAAGFFRAAATAGSAAGGGGSSASDPGVFPGWAPL